jgi:hypothetical protein
MPGALGIMEALDLRSADATIASLDAGARACRETPIRRGSIERVEVSAGSSTTDARLIATGDLHDNPVHLLRLLSAAGMCEPDANDATASHLTLHELIHGDKLLSGMDFSYRLLARVAALKAAFPTKLHVLLANHELAQALGQAVAKDGVRCNEVFDEALESVFADQAGRVREAITRFVLSLPLAVLFHIDGPPVRRVLCSHSLPGPELMSRFDPAILNRALTDEDYRARQGSAHLMVWGRGHAQAQLDELARLWNVDLFVLGHEKAEDGVLVLGPSAMVLNSDHERGVYIPIDLRSSLAASELSQQARSLSHTPE